MKEEEEKRKREQERREIEKGEEEKIKRLFAIIAQHKKKENENIFDRLTWNYFTEA
jgi:hypothetical protein